MFDYMVFFLFFFFLFDVRMYVFDSSIMWVFGSSIMWAFGFFFDSQPMDMYVPGLRLYGCMYVLAVCNRSKCQ